MFPEKVIKALETGGDVEKAVEESMAPMRNIIEQMLTNRPFMPFRIHMTSKWSHEVWFPERLQVDKTVLHTLVPDPSEPTGLRVNATLSMLHVVSLETMPVDQPTVVDGTSDIGNESGR